MEMTQRTGMEILQILCQQHSLSLKCRFGDLETSLIFRSKPNIGNKDKISKYLHIQDHEKKKSK